MVNPVTVIRQPSEATEVVINYGEEWEQRMSLACQWFALISSAILIIWYTKQTYQKQCGWEEFYVCIVESASCATSIGSEMCEQLLRSSLI